jgi:rhodanese-related sulfurtransferase
MMNAVQTDALKALDTDEYLLIDTRKPEVFAEGFAEGAINIPFNQTFTENLQYLPEEDERILVIADEAEIPTVMKALKASGVQGIQGYLQNGFATWQEAGKPTDMLIAIEADEFKMDYQFDEFYLIDLRTADDYKVEHVEDSENIEMAELERTLAELSTEDSYYIYGETGQDAIIAASIFRRYGFERVRPVTSDFAAIKESGVPLTVKKKDQAKNN